VGEETLIKLTSEEDMTHAQTHWGEETTHEIPYLVRNAKLCQEGILHAYRRLNLALLLNPIHGNYSPLHIWSAKGEVCAEDWGKVGCHKLTTTERLDQPDWYQDEALRKKVQTQFAVLCAEAVLSVFEDLYPEDNRPRLAIEAAKACLVSASAATVSSASCAATAATHTATTVTSAASASAASASAAYAAIAASCAAHAAYAASCAAHAASCAATAANKAAVAAAKTAAEATAEATAAGKSKIDFWVLADTAVKMVMGGDRGCNRDTLARGKFVWEENKMRRCPICHWFMTVDENGNYYCAMCGFIQPKGTSRYVTL
jgi:hypothetical protein